MTPQTTPVELSSDRARIVRHSRRRGRSACINTGLEAAQHDTVLIIDDDIYAAPDMVIRLVDEFAARKNSKLGLTARVTWDPDLPLTLSMRWMETVHKFPSPMLLSRSFILDNGDTMKTSPAVWKTQRFNSASRNKDSSCAASNRLSDFKTTSSGSRFGGA
jgi:glycosyltransferase involved in cell wall biosynthesis